MATDSTTYSTTGEVTTWQVITGSARGAAHRASGLPNQDAVASQDGPGGVVVAIADGHGHIRHFRSADGAALAVDVACRAASRTAAGLAADDTQFGRVETIDLSKMTIAGEGSGTATVQVGVTRAKSSAEVTYTLIVGLYNGSLWLINSITAS